MHKQVQIFITAKPLDRKEAKLYADKSNGSYCITLILPFFYPHVLPLSKHIHICRADNTAVFKIQFLNSVGAPADDAGHSKNGRVQLPGNPNHLIDKARIEIQVGTDGALLMPILLYALNTPLFNLTQKLILRKPPFFLCHWPTNSHNIL